MAEVGSRSSNIVLLFQVVDAKLVEYTPDVE
jgi:hypothetical protein